MTLLNVDQFNNKVWVPFFSWISLPSEAMIMTIMVLKSKRSFAFALLFLTCFAVLTISNATDEILSVLDCLDSIYLSIGGYCTRNKMFKSIIHNMPFNFN